MIDVLDLMDFQVPGLVMGMEEEKRDDLSSVLRGHKESLGSR